MKSIYYFLVGISLLAFGFSGVATSINAHLGLVYHENPSPKKQDKPQPKKHKEAKGNAKITHFSLLTGEITTTDALALPPSITATKSVAVQGGGNAVPGSQLNYTIVINNGGTDATGVAFNDILVSDLTLVAGSVKATPIIVDDSYNCIGNVGITVPANSGLLANDVNPMNSTMTATVINQAGTQGVVVANPDGSFTFTPVVGYTGTTTFTYTASNGSFASTATVSIVVSAPIWFVNIAAATNGTGTLASPFKDWSDFATSNALTGATNPAASQTIFVYSGTYTGAATLKTGQKVLGQGATTTLASFAGVTVPTFSNALPATSGTNPNLTSSGTTITIPTTSTITLRGFDMGNSTTDISSGASFGTLTTSEMALNGNGKALNLASGILSASFTSISSTNSSAEGIYLLSVSGSLTSTGGTTITNPTAVGIAVYSASSVNANFGGTNITGSGGAGLYVSGAANNTATLTFGDLDIAPDATQNAINFFGSGSLTCTSGTITASNTPGSTAGIGIAGGSAAQKATLSMVLNSFTMTGTTGTTIGLDIQNTLGSFTINGTGTTAGSGGTISTIQNRGVQVITASNITLKNMNFVNANTVGGTAFSTTDISGSNAAIYCNGVNGVTLDNIQMNTTTGNVNAQNGITLFNVTNFNLANSTITRCGTDNEEACIMAVNTSGTCTISNSTISKASRCARFTNNSTNMTLKVTGSSFNDTRTYIDPVTPTPDTQLNPQGGAGILFEGFGSSVMSLDVKSACNFLRIATSGVDALASDNAVVSADVQNSIFNSTNANLSVGEDVGLGVHVQSGVSGVVKFNILNNTITGRGGDLINVGATATNTRMEGTIDGNTVNYNFKSTINNNGGSGIGIVHNSTNTTSRVKINNNTITNIAGTSGISATVNGGSSGRADIICTNNNVTLITTNYGVGNAITPPNYAFLIGSAGTSTICSKVANNTSNAGILGIARIRAGAAGDIHLVEGSGLGSDNITNLETIWNNLRTTGTVASAGQIVKSGTGTHTLSAVGTCASPSNPLINLSIPSPVLVENLPKETPTESVNQIEAVDTLAEEEISTDAKPSTESTNSSAKIAAPLSGETVTVNGSGSGFSLPAGKSTTVTFSATVSSTPSTCAITNQASISYTGGSVNSTIATTNLIVPPPTGVTGATSICNGQSVSLSATCPSGTIQWYTTAAPSTLLGTGSPFSQSPIVNTTYTAKCLVGGCESVGTNSGLITVNALPVPAPGSNSPVCTGATLNLTSASSTSYVWTGPNSFSSTLRNPSISNVSIVAGGTYTVTQTNSFGCTALATVSATVNAVPNATASSGTPSICVGGTINLVSSGGGTYLWNGPSTFTSSQQNPSITNATTGATGTYIVTVTNNGCTATNNVVVTVNANPTATPSSNSPLCAGTTLNLSSSAASGYLWSGPNTFTSSQQNPVINTVTSAAGGTYTLRVTNASGCTGTATTAVVINTTAVPTAPTATPSSRATTGSVTLSATGCAGGTLAWFNASTNFLVPAPNNQPNFTTSGTFNFYAKCIGANSCVSDASANVSVTVSLCTPLASSPGNVGINWTGLEGTDWNNPCNWNPAWVPDATNSAVVINLRTNQPTISGTVPNVNLIYVNSGATLTVNNGGTLNASSTTAVLTLQGGNLINDGTINLSGGGTSVGLAIGATASITNRGTITTNNLYGASLQFGNLTFTNESTGIFSGDFKANNNILTLTNSGTINYAGGTYALSLGSAGSSVVNTGTISVTSGSGISNPSGSTITNNACGKILMTASGYENGGTTINAGLIQMPNLFDFTNIGTFTNNGVVKANTVSGITNNRMVITNACPIFTLGGTNNYTVSGIFTNAGATTSAGTYVSVGNKFTANNTIPTGTQTLYAQVSNGTCTFVVPFDFNNRKPTAVSVNKTAICTGANVTLSGTCSSGTLTWYTDATGGSSIGTGTSLSQSPTVATTYYAACESTNCVSGRVATSEVTVSNPPFASANSNSPICAGETLNLNSGSEGNTYLWTGPNSFTSTELSPSIANATVSATGTYTITITNASSCTATATVAVTVNAIPAATASSNSPVCIGNTISLTGGGVGTYAWSGPNGFSSTAQSPTIANATVLASGTYTITVTGLGSCTSTATTAVTVNGLATASVTPSTQTICSGGAITTIAISGTGISYAWTRDNTTSATGIAASGSGDISGSLTNTANTPLTVTFTITPVGACNGTPITATVIINPIPTATASTPSQSICSGAAISGVTLTNLTGGNTANGSEDDIVKPKDNPKESGGITFGPSVAGTVFNWTRDNTATVTGIPASGSGNITGSLTNTTASPITVTFTVTPSYTNAGKLCTGTPITVTVTVNPNPASATITDAGTAFCSGSSTTLSAPADPNYTYAWERSLTGIANPNSFTTFGGTAQTQVITTSGVYRSVVTNQYNCSARDTTAVKFGDIVFSGSLAAGDAQQTGRMNRFAVVSTCAAPKSYPGDFTTTGARFYDSYTVTNPTNAPICATIGLTSGCATNIFSAAYLGSFNPASVGTNYLADPGSSFPNTAFYEATIPANGTIVVVVHERDVNIGCSNYNLRIDVPGATVAPTASSNSPICAGNTLNLTGTGTGTYAWIGPNSFTSSAQNPTIANATTLATGTYTISVTNTNGCVFNATTAVTVNANPTATASSNSPICAGNTLNLTGGGVGTAYAWVASNGYTSNVQSPTISNATVSASGTYTVTVTNANGCTSTASVVVTVNATPTATASSSTPVICAGNTISLTGGGIGTYLWSGPNGYSSTAQSPTISNASVLATGTYMITVTNVSGCTSTASVAVTVNALPTATASSSTPAVCVGNTISLTGGGVGTYAWTGPSGYTSSAQSPSITNAIVANSGTYMITVTNANNCTSTATVAVTVNSNPSATASSNSPICAVNTLNLTGGGIGTYLWSGPNGYSSTVQSPTISNATVLATGTYTITVMNVSGCTSTATTAVTVNALPTATASTSTPSVCSGITISLVGGGVGTYSWTGPNGYSSTAQSPTIASATVLASGIYKIAVTNVNGCTSTATTSVTVNPLPVVDAGANQTICEGSTASLTATCNLLTFNTTLSGTSEVPANASTATGNVSGTYDKVSKQLLLTFSFNGLAANASAAHLHKAAVGTNGPVQIPFPSVPAVTSGSFTYTGTLTALQETDLLAGLYYANIHNANFPGGEIRGQLITTCAANNFVWNPGSLSGQTVIVSPITTQIYTVIASNTTTGCSTTATTTVNVNPRPVPTIGSNTPVCAGNTLDLNAGGGTTYAWSGPNAFTATGANPSISSVTLLATGTYTVTVTNVNGCTNTATTAVVINALPTATASNNSPICSGVTLNLTSGGVGTYAWSGPSGYTSTAQSPSIASATASMSGIYTITVTNVNGCTSTATTSVTVNPVVTTPTPQANTQIIFGASITLTATGCSGVNDVLKWYKSSDNSLAVMPVSPTATTNYYAKCETTLNGITCISGNSTDVTVTVLSPNPPVATGATNCIETPTTLTATGCSGSVGTFVLKWYQNADDALVTMPVSPLVSTDYYAKCEQTFNSVTAVSAKSNVVTLTILNPPTPVSTGGTIYNGQSISLTATGCTGTLGTFTLKWYQTADNVLVTMPVSPTVTTQYYSKCEQTANSITCLSPKSNDVTVTVVNRIFVDITKIAAPIQNGNSWATAYGNLQTGLAAATAGVEVWVAKGTYKPTNTIDRNITFDIPNNVIVYGGFAGTEDNLIDRNFRTNISILSGDIGTLNLDTDNSYHVVVMNGSSISTVLDGFTITGGYANFDPKRTYNTSPLAPTTTTIETGGGIVVQNGGMPTIANCTVIQNAAVTGGGLFAGDASKPNIMFCKFMGNQAGFGSGLYLQDGSHAKVNNTLISGNKGIGAVYNNGSNPMITNTTFGGNGGYNGGIFNSNSQPVVKNSIIWGNSTPFNDTQSIITYSTIQGGYAGTGNLSMDPKYVSPMPDGLAPITTGDYHLQASSLAIDRGDNGAISLTDKDLDGNLRRFAGGRVDMGAYEFQGTATATLVISIQTGNWESNSTWDIGRVPQLGDYVIIDNSHIVTLTGTGIAKNLEYRGTGQLKFNATTSKLEIGF